MNQPIITTPIKISDDIMKKWQSIVDIIAELINIPSALIMRLIDDDIEVFVSSQSQDNPYTPGAKEYFQNSGLYCETVIRSNEKLLVPNALKDEDWKNNPDVKLNMISYLGFPILFPDGNPFGTICVLDNKENTYSKTFENLIEKFRDIIQSQLELIYMNDVLGEENRKLVDFIDEIKTLRGIIPICINCKQIKDSKGYWTRVEKYIEDHTDAKFSHGLCDDCMVEIYGDQPWFQKSMKKKKTQQ